MLLRRFRFVFVLIALSTMLAMLPVSAWAETDTKAVECAKITVSEQPRLLRVSMYSWGLGSGRVEVDVKSGWLSAFTRGMPNVDEKELLDPINTGKLKTGINWVNGKLTETEGKELLRLVLSSGLRSFQPSAEHINHRDAMIDECPPSLVLTWSDRTEVYVLPLSGTVKEGLSGAAWRAYQGMSDICGFLCKSEYDRRKPPILRVLTYDELRMLPDYEDYLRDRDRVSL